MKKVAVNKMVFSGMVVLILILAAIILTQSTTSKSPEQKFIGKAGLALVAEQPFEEIVRDSQAAVIGTVTEISGTRLASENKKFFEDANAYRVVKINVERILFDDIGIESQLELIVLGGKIELPEEEVVKRGFPKDTKIVRVYEDEAEFEKGEKVLVFLKKGVYGFKMLDGTEELLPRLALTGAWQGKYTIKENKAIHHLPSRSIELEDLINKVSYLRGQQKK
jgi:hypothetical protein